LDFGLKAIALLLTRLGLRFDDPALEDKYKASLAQYAVHRARIAMGLAIVTNAVFGIWDLTSASGGLMSTRFRFMVALLAFGILSCKTGYQLGSGNCRKTNGRIVAVPREECLAQGGTVELPVEDPAIPPPPAPRR
jgi:hypothetical protein